VVTKAVCIIAALLASGCATQGAVRQLDLKVPVAGERVSPAPAPSAAPLSAAARRQTPAASAQTVEGSDPGLGAALAALAMKATAENHRAVADEYLRLGILDMAHEHLASAVTLNPRDAAAWDLSARIWRSGGFLDHGLADAYRALTFAPASPVVRNTLGTLLLGLGRRAEARAEFEKAILLDSSAAYALNNLCYSWLLEGRAPEAVGACRRAAELQPELEAARNNLGLALAATGDMEAAEQAFGWDRMRGRAKFNLGIAYLARREYSKAATAFEAARALRPSFAAADVMAYRARQADTRSPDR
jgi:Flp pilus assembly protein TadD